MRVADRLILTGIIYMLIFSIYMIWSDKPIVYKYFWRTYFYLMIYSLPMVMYIIIIPLCYNYPQALLLCWSLILFFAGFIVFNLILINKEYTVFYNYCTSQLYRYIFTGFIMLLIFISLFVKCFIK
jgi:hypothetical protein